jgi:hypothetical protein
MVLSFFQEGKNGKKVVWLGDGGFNAFFRNAGLCGSAKERSAENGSHQNRRPV